jgi:O-antigen ligase
MIAILIIAILLLSLTCSFVLNKPHLAVLLLVLASGQMRVDSHEVIYAILFTVILHFFHTFFLTKQNKSFLLVSFLPIIYIIAIFLIQPYTINIHFYLGYSTALFLFAWVTLLKWEFKNIVQFLTYYGFFLVSTGFIEKVVTDKLRIEGPLSVATAYAVVLVIVWTIWIISASLYKIYSKKIILLGTLLVFFAVIFSGTRMGLVGIFIGFGLLALTIMFIKGENLNILKMAIYSVSIIALLVILSIIVWNLLPNDLLIKKTFSTLIAGKLDSSNQGRILIWISAANIFNEHKLLGIGAGNFPEKYKSFLQSINIYGNSGINRYVGADTHAHNIYLIILSEHGIIGFLILGIFVFLCISQLFLYFSKNRQEPISYAFFSGFLVMTVLGLVDGIPMYLPTACFAAWFLGICASFRNRDMGAR